jgi:hypothetical protein
MKDTREDTRAIPSHTLDKIRNPSEACLSIDLTYLVMPKYLLSSKVLLF